MDKRKLRTIVAGSLAGSLAALTIAHMTHDAPMYVWAIPTFPFIGLLIYSLLSMARAGGG